MNFGRGKVFLKIFKQIFDFVEIFLGKCWNYFQFGKFFTRLTFHDKQFSQTLELGKYLAIFSCKHRNYLQFDKFFFKCVTFLGENFPQFSIKSLFRWTMGWEIYVRKWISVEESFSQNLELGKYLFFLGINNAYISKSFG